MHLDASKVEKIPALLFSSFMETSDKRRLGIVKNVRKHNFQKGTVIFLQGIADSSRRYKNLFSKLVDRGFSYASFDWYGQGASIPSDEKERETAQRTFDINRHIGDLEEFLDKIVYADCPPPYYFLGYDIGCLIAISSIDIINNQCNRFLGISPFFSPLGHKIGGFEHKISEMMNDFGLGHIKLRQGKSIFQSYHFNKGYSDSGDHKEEDFAVLDRRWLAHVFDTAIYAKERLEKNDLRFPALFVTGHNDRLTDASEVRRFCHNVRLADTITLIGAGHDLLNDKENYQKQFWALFDAFIPGTNAYEINH